ncbi:MAG: signal peptidase I [Ruminococcus sp.]|nr:signal peptidase I [Ruminococcus sp.]
MKQKTEKKKFRVGAAIFRIILILVAGLTVGLAVFSFNANRIGGNQLPMPFGYGASVVLSGSMEPALQVNDLVIVKAQEDYSEGDVVVYQNGNTLIIHRVVKKDGEEFVTRGDANNADDDPIRLSDIKGIMIFRVPFIGLIFKWLKTLPGTLIVLGLAIFLLYRSRRKEKEKDSEQLDEIVEEIRRLQALQQSTAQPQPIEQPAVGNDAPIVPQKEATDTVGNDAPIVPQNETTAENAENDVPIVPQNETPSTPDDFSDIDALISEIEND